MFALLSRLSRSRKVQTCESTMPARAASVETLEDRRLYSVSSGGDLSFSWGESQTGTSTNPRLLVPAVKPSGQTNIIAVLVGM
jgi:hypothetical protein